MRRHRRIVQQQRSLSQQEQQQGQNQAISLAEKIGGKHLLSGYSVPVRQSYNANVTTVTRHAALHAGNDSAIIVDTVS